jgi:hypothetical protein
MDFKKTIKGKVEFYLDRAIYRPYNSLLQRNCFLERTRQNEYCRKNVLSKTIKEDTNGSVFKEFDVLTNEYGSFSENFYCLKMD